MSTFRAAVTLIAFSVGVPHGPAQDKKPPLVTRDRVLLNLAGAEVVLEAAKKKAAEMGLKVNIAIVDDGGHLLSFARTDGARPASGNTALT